MKLLLLAICFIAVHAASGQAAGRRRRAPSVCDGAKLRYGVGFNRHPYDCSQYVQCFYLPGSKHEPVYRNCEFGKFWDQVKFQCQPSEYVDCAHDKCKLSGVPYYKHSDPNKCSAYYKCVGGKAKAACCPEGQTFHPKKGCIPSTTCTDMCPLVDKVPGCNRRPVSRTPSRYMQYIGDGQWVKEKCPPKYGYNPADCGCTLKDLIVVGRRCEPDVRISFDRGQIKDISGNKYRIHNENVRVFNGAGYFNGKARLLIEPFRPSAKDEGVLIVKLRYKARYENDVRGSTMQALFTNGHCKDQSPSVLAMKMPRLVVLGASTTKYERAFELATTEKPWKEVIYNHDGFKLEGRVCGAAKNEYAYGPLKQTGCGFQFGMAKGYANYIGLLDDIAIYRCKPLDAVVNLNY